MGSISTTFPGSPCGRVVARECCPAATHLDSTVRSPSSSTALQLDDLRLDDQVADQEVEQQPNPHEESSSTRSPEVGRLAAVHDRYCRLCSQRYSGLRSPICLTWGRICLHGVTFTTPARSVCSKLRLWIGLRPLSPGDQNL